MQSKYEVGDIALTNFIKDASCRYMHYELKRGKNWRDNALFTSKAKINVFKKIEWSGPKGTSKVKKRFQKR